MIAQFHAEQLVHHVCFNLEMWSEPLFDQDLPGQEPLRGLRRAGSSRSRPRCGYWGRGNVYSAMVAGIELEPEHGLEWEDAARIALAGAEDLCRRGIVPIYSLVWPVGGRQRPDFHARIHSYFETLSTGYVAIRQRHGLRVADSFMCHRCAYMQLECDIDRVEAVAA